MNALTEREGNYALSPDEGVKARSIVRID